MTLILTLTVTLTLTLTLTLALALTLTLTPDLRALERELHAVAATVLGVSG